MGDRRSSRALTGSGLNPRAPDRYRAACRSLRYRLRLTERHGSVLVALAGLAPTLAQRPHPGGHGLDAASGSCFSYHCQRQPDPHGVGGHGHLHLFVPAAPGAEPTHLIAVSLEARGLPIGLFTLNRWVAGDAWLPAAATAALLERFSFPAPRRGAAAEQGGTDPRLGRWLTHILAFYRPEITALLEERDACLARRAQGSGLEAALDDRRLEIRSQRPIDWSADLARLQARLRPGPTPWSKADGCP